MRKQTLVLVCGLLFLLILTGCNLNLNTTVNEDGSGSMSIEIGYTGDEMELWLEEENLPADYCVVLWYDEGLSDEMPAGATIRTEQRGDQTWCIVNFGFSSLEALEEMYSSNFDMYVNQLEIDEENFTCDITWDLWGLEEDAPSVPEIVFIMTVPGSVESTNANIQLGRTLTWNLDENGENSIQVISSTKSLDWIWWVVGGLGCLCLGTLVVAGIVALIIILRKKNK